ncbi:MAG: tetratricopeptide repeat protein [Deltaproteobacteria bacterium]|nr:tetratricopeptide repeat protein [Deltaproteobacteria bacterium]
MEEIYTDLKNQIGATTNEPLEFLVKTVPILEIEELLREKLLEVLVKFRVPAAFFMSRLPTTVHLTPARKMELRRENLQIHSTEIITYLGQYFGEKENLVTRLDHKNLENELNERKLKYDEYMAQAVELKKNRSYEEAINCLRLAIEVFPEDIEAYIESGRIFMHKKEYGRALTRFTQAQNFFEDSPSPNTEIGNMRLIQVEEKITGGADPNSPEILKLLNDAVANFKQATDKALKITETQTSDPILAGREIASSVGQVILSWDLGTLIGIRHPVIRDLIGVAYRALETLEGIDEKNLSARQFIALGMKTLEDGDFEQAKNYYFRALEDKDYYNEACTEINYFGMKLRSMGLLKEALSVYESMLSYKPHNISSVYWNMAIVFSHQDDPIKSSGYMTRALYLDPQLATSLEFYSTFTPKLIKNFSTLLNILKHISKKAGHAIVPASLVNLYQVKKRLVELIEAGSKTEAMKLFVALNKKAQKFTCRPEFYAESAVLEFAREMKEILIIKDVKQTRGSLQVIESWLAGYEKHPPPGQLIKYSGLIRAATDAMEEGGDQLTAAFYLCQAIMVVPTAYFDRSDFYVHETLPALSQEILSKMKYVDPEKFPKDQDGISRFFRKQ